MTIDNYLVLIPLVMQTAGLFVTAFLDRYLMKTQRRIILLISVLELTLIIQNGADFSLGNTKIVSFLRIFVIAYGYCIRPLIIVLFFYLVSKRRSFKLFWILICINAAIYLTAFFSDLSFSFSESGYFSRGPLAFSCHIISVLALLYLLYLTLSEFRRVPKRESVIPIINAALIVASIAVEMLFDPIPHLVSYLTIAIVSCSLFYYIWLHMQFVREHERALMAEQRIQIMMTQIQPHFLYNTLSTIQALCRTDPEKAFTVTERFGTYLRQNIDSLSQPNLIPVEKELEHTKIYTEIECVRFDNIIVEYDTPETGFSIPALTIQPLVENAIRHGVRIRDKGIVKVATAKVDGGYQIVIEDNGKGFDTSLIKNDNSEHIGICNVKERLASMVGGRLDIESIEDVGTKITIIIPSKRAEQYNNSKGKQK